MQWWNNFVSWLTAISNQPVVFGAVVLVVALIVASVLAAWISRGAVRGLLDQRDRELKSAVISTLVDAAADASVWNSLTTQEQVMADRAVGHADIQLRLLPIRGAGIAANWAAHQLADLKRTSATFGYQLEPAVAEFRDRLVDWQNKPSRARKIFQGDIDRWKLQDTSSEKSLLAERDAWVAQQHHDDFTRLESESAGAPRSFEPTHQATMQAEPAVNANVNANVNDRDRDRDRDTDHADAAKDNARQADARQAAAVQADAAQAGRAPISYAPLGYTPATPSTPSETQQLLDDVEALEVRQAEPYNPTGPVATPSQQ
ncbi:hypothetical protein [Cryobacterium tagatosivorans]|uniref:Uncharacterized protein n=1 Tax=Cryobacterium tagatosivorans TaxID=1259199 RepID=A0A4R8UCP1_9MICO|nr:hypothetical protein [Cryobacterium tagatosivorans]TFB46497.1 hypothetical protein E3O23_17055 [Cryobacterium tagatosivorans]